MASAGFDVIVLDWGRIALHARAHTLSRLLALSTRDAERALASSRCLLLECASYEQAMAMVGRARAEGLEVRVQPHGQAQSEHDGARCTLPEVQRGEDTGRLTMPEVAAAQRAPAEQARPSAARADAPITLRPFAAERAGLEREAAREHDTVLVVPRLAPLPALLERAAPANDAPCVDPRALAATALGQTLASAARAIAQTEPTAPSQSPRSEAARANALVSHAPAERPAQAAPLRAPAAQPPSSQAAAPAHLTLPAARVEPWCEPAASPDLSARAASTSSFAAGFGEDLDLDRLVPRRMALSGLVASADLMRDSSLPFPEAPRSADGPPARESLGFLLSFPERGAAQAPTRSDLTRKAAQAPAWPRVHLEHGAFAPEQDPAPAPARQVHDLAARSVSPTRPSLGASALASEAPRSRAPDPVRAFRPPRLTLGVNDGGGTGLPRRTVWLLAVLWLSVGLLLWSRGLLF